jgi:hypothetical protein
LHHAAYACRCRGFPGSNLVPCGTHAASVLWGLSAALHDAGKREEAQAWGSVISDKGPSRLSVCGTDCDPPRTWSSPRTIAAPCNLQSAGTFFDWVGATTYTRLHDLKAQPNASTLWLACCGVCLSRRSIYLRLFCRGPGSSSSSSGVGQIPRAWVDIMGSNPE